MKRGIRKWCFTPALIFGLVLFSVPAQALVISDSTHVLDNLSPPGYTLSDLWGGAYGQVYVAAPFHTDSSAYSLSKVTLMLRSWINPGIPVVDLHVNNGSLPGTRIDTLAWAYPGVLKGEYFKPVLFSAVDGIYLAPSTTYWIVLHSAYGDLESSGARKIGGDSEWPNCTGFGFQPGMLGSQDGGQTWFDCWQMGSVELMRVEANPVPEPASLLLIGSGLAAGMMRLRRKFKK